MSSFKPGDLFSLFYDSIQDLSRDYGSVHSAAPGYYILLSILPLATLSAAIITRNIGPMSHTGDYEALLSNIVDNQYSGMIHDLITKNYSIAADSVWTILNILVLIYASSYMFYQARISLDARWCLSPKPGGVNLLWAPVKTCSLAYNFALLVG
jgi:uncharacterized BrkB/YihY/UPF0761 family membrane protein